MISRWSVLFGCTLLIAGCAGDSSVSPSRFAGNYRGTWVNIADSADAGTSEWGVDGSGGVSGQDFDSGRQTTFTVSGRVDSNGNLVSRSTPNNGTPSATLDGPMHFDSEGRLNGLFVWGVEPPLTYRYTFTRR